MRRVLLVAFDVTDLTDEESDMLAMEATVQGEASEYHGDVVSFGHAIIPEGAHKFADTGVGSLFVSVLWPT